MVQPLIPRLVGLLLLLAAGLKFHGLGTAPISPIGFFSAAWFQAGMVVAEMLLGFWLIAGVAPRGSWVLALGAFSGFALFASFQGIKGSSSCGCFGSLSLNPWFAVILDVLVLVGLVFGRPGLDCLWINRMQRIKATLRVGGPVLAGVFLLGGLLFGCAHLAFGSVSGAIAHLRGERVSIEPNVADVGVGAPGESRQILVTLTNWTDEPIQVFGGKGSPGVFTRRASFVVNDNGFKKLGFILTGTLQPKVDQ